MVSLALMEVILGLMLVIAATFASTLCSVNGEGAGPGVRVAVVDAHAARVGHTDAIGTGGAD